MNVRLVALVTIAALVLTGVGGGIFVVVDHLRGNDQERYCQSLAENQQLFAADSSGGVLLGALDDLRGLAGKAPADLSDEWQIVIAALGGLDSALDQAGVGPADFAGGQAPASLSEQEQARIAAAASQLTSPAVVDAFAGIDQQAKDVCKLQLGL